MKFWDFDKRPYRPVEAKRFSRVITLEDGSTSAEYECLDPDVFIDSLGRIWYAPTRQLMEQLPADPLGHQKIPPQFWHPDRAKKAWNDDHEAKKKEHDDRRAELQLI